MGLCCKRRLQTTSSEPVEGSDVYKSPPALPPPLLLPGLCGFAICLLPSSCSCIFEIPPTRFDDRGILHSGVVELGVRMVSLLCTF